MNDISEDEKNSFSFENPPPVKNYPLYCWRIFVKLLSFALFGLGTILISIVAFPIMKLLFWKKERFRKAGHHFISVMFRFFVLFMKVIRGSTLTAKDKRKFRSLKSSIVVANHPSLLDVVMLISLIPDADCIVNSYLVGKNIVHLIASNLYIPTSLHYDEIMEKCISSLSSGSNLIIFPEGTRSLPSGQNKFKKGAARISIVSGCPIVPVYIGGNDKRGLRKHDPIFKYNTQKMYHYNVVMKDTVFPKDYAGLPKPTAAKRITEHLATILSDENNAEFIERY